MWSRAKQFVSNIAHVTKSYIAPSYITVTQIASGAGQVLYVIPKFVRYLINKEEYPFSKQITIFNVGSSILTLISSRTYFVFKHFNTDTHEDEIEIKTVKGKIAVGISSAIGVYNATSSSLGNYLFSLVLMETINNTIHQMIWYESEHKEDLSIVPLAQAVALTFFVSKFFATYSFTLKRSRDNIKRLVRDLEDDEHHLEFDHRALAITLVSSFVGSIPTPFFAYFASSAAIAKIPYVTIPENINHILAAASAGAAFFVTVSTAPVSLYRVISKHKKNEEPTTCVEIPINIIGYTALTSDMACTAISNFTSMTNTSERVFGIDSKNIYLIIGSGICSTSAAMLNFFMTREAYKETLHHFKHRNDQAGYHEIPNDPQKEANQSSQRAAIVEIKADGTLEPLPSTRPSINSDETQPIIIKVGSSSHYDTFFSPASIPPGRTPAYRQQRKPHVASSLPATTINLHIQDEKQGVDVQIEIPKQPKHGQIPYS